MPCQLTPFWKKPAAVQSLRRGGSDAGAGDPGAVLGRDPRGGRRSRRPGWARRTVWGPSGGMNSGSSGASRASSSERRTARSMLASSNSLAVTVPVRVPKFDCTTSVVSSLAPAVDTLLRA